LPNEASHAGPMTPDWNREALPALDEPACSLIQLENRLKPNSGFRRLCRNTQTRTYEPRMSYKK